MHFTKLLPITLVAALVTGHPGHDHAKELSARLEFLANNKNDLSHCAEQMRAQGLDASSARRRSQLAEQLMKRQGLNVRDISALSNNTHKSTAGYTPQTDLSTVFAGNNSCVLSPEQIEGPYYVAGERIRQDVTEGQAGVPLAVDIQIVDMETCKPIPDVYLEIWHCNATGVYGGVLASANGAGDADKSNLNNTMLRGVQRTDADGAVQFHTIFPGHYTGRTAHIHVAVHLNASAQPNGTLLDTTAAHVGQMYFDQDLIAAVETRAPYTANKQPLTTNAQDFLLTAAAAGASDPLMEYVVLGPGGGVEGGLLAWLSFGINTTLAREISAAATIYEDGGVTNPNAGMGGSFPSGFPSEFPTGFPSGFPTGFPSGFATGFPSGFTSGFPFPPGTLPTASPLPTQTRIPKN